MKKINITIMALVIAFNFAAAQNQAEKDTAKVYRVPGVTVSTTRAEDRKDPVPHSELTETDLEEIYTVKDVPRTLSILPSVISYSQNGSGIGYSILTMRGFDQRRISVMINGIPQNDPEDHQVYWINFPDISSSLDNIQIQRGAGIMNYGAAAIGGSINLTTSDYIKKSGVKVFSGFGLQQYGSGGETKFQRLSDKASIEVSSGLMGDFAVYGRLSSINSKGYRDNAWADLQSYFLSAAMFRDNFSAQLNVFGGPVSDGLAYVGLPKKYIEDKQLRRKNANGWTYGENGKNIAWFSPVREQEIEEFSQPHYELLIDWDISKNLKLKSSLFYYTGDGFYNYDGSWAGGYYDADNNFYYGMLADWVSVDYDFDDENSFSMPVIQGNVTNKQGGWIPRLIWDHDGGELTLGAEMRLHRSKKWGEVPFSEFFPAGWDPDYEFYSSKTGVDIFSFFAGERFYASDNLILSADAQLVYKKYSMFEAKRGSDFLEFETTDGETVGKEKDIFNAEYLFLNPRIGATYNWDENLSLYSSVAYTSREPRMRNLYAAEDAWFGAQPQFHGRAEGDKRLYDFSDPFTVPESMLDIELGSSWQNEKLYFNVNFYWMEYFDELVKSGQTDIWGNPIDGNAERTRHYGLELTAAAEIFRNSAGRLKITGNATFSENKIVEYDFKTYSGESISLKGNDIAGFPEAMANIMMEYSNGGFYANLTARFVGDYRTDNFGDMIKNDERIKNHLMSELSYYYADNTLDAYNVFNTTLSYTFNDIISFKSIKLLAQVYNLFNNIYAAGAEGKDFFPAAERNFFFGIEFGI